MEVFYPLLMLKLLLLLICYKQHLNVVAGRSGVHFNYVRVEMHYIL